MLTVKQIAGSSFEENDTGETLFKKNQKLQFHIRAPMYWWLDCDFEKYQIVMPTGDFEFCFDAWAEDAPFIRNTKFVLQNATQLSPRELMQALPLSTYLDGMIELTYQKIIEVCENYQCGEYDFQELYNQWPMTREWADFCETLLDIKGVRDILERSVM